MSLSSMPDNIIVRLNRVPDPGVLPADIFDLVTEPVPELRSGQILVEILYQAIDAGSRGMLDSAAGYVLTVPPGDRLPASASIGRVFSSLSDQYGEGVLVRLFGGTRQRYQRIDPSRCVGLQVLEPDVGEPLHYLGILGITGFTAWLGITDICRPVPGETVLISVAAGAVGSAAGQFAKALGARVVGIAGGATKCQYVRDQFGFDDCVDYKAADFTERLAQACPQGVNSYFENVGGAVQRAAFALLRDFGRVAMCGQVAQYNGGGEVPGANLMTVVNRQLEVRGFLAHVHYHRLPEFMAQVGQWYREGKLVQPCNVVQGLENLHEAINSLVEGRNIGQQVHQLTASR
ncbi:putative NADP-dependent oxidoreductase [Pseudomonas sp. GM21]|uniref:MDR family NADP-dependent oxidoreductase n=1 Tax=Pseudomonas sp. GM21 TaxID=1144325 RepID=UPI00027228F1|nr:NADP-dependent oxidoreductase [Pseudomonas sp. GM21]EJM21062.1 putative NADP-dependent oxidoreductase [Pseudomonas sp. GM21]